MGVKRSKNNKQTNKQRKESENRASLINISSGAEKPSVTGEGEEKKRRAREATEAEKGERGTVNWEQMKTRAQGAKTDDKYALTSNRDSARNKGAG